MFEKFVLQKIYHVFDVFGTCSFQKIAMCFTCLRVWDLFRPLLDQLVPVFGVFDAFGAKILLVMDTSVANFVLHSLK